MSVYPENPGLRQGKEDRERDGSMSVYPENTALPQGKEDRERDGRITVYLTDTALLHTKEDWQRCAQGVDAVRLYKARQCRNPEDQKRSLLAGLLIQTAVRERRYRESGGQGIVPPLSLEYLYGENGKPYLKNEPGIFFSLSHSGTRVICAVSDGEVGADIQRYAGEKRRVADRFFSAQDRELIEEGIQKGRSREEMFCRIWTVKEACMKLTGQGMRLGMERIRLEFADREKEAGDSCFAGRVGTDGNTCFRGPGEADGDACFAGCANADGYACFAGRIMRDGYALAVCSRRETADIDLKWVKVGKGVGTDEGKDKTDVGVGEGTGREYGADRL